MLADQLKTPPHYRLTMQPAPEHTESELLQFRRNKLEELQKRGIAAFGGKFEVTHNPGTLKANFTEGLDVRVAGRILSRRQMGKATFLTIRDGFGDLQVGTSGGRAPPAVGWPQRWQNLA